MNRFEKTLRLTYSDLLSRLRSANVAMFHVGRVGSTVLGKMLDQHASVFWEGEFYVPHSFRNLQHRVGEKNAIELLRMRMTAARLRIFGFETKCHRLQDFERIEIGIEKYIKKLINIGFTHFILLERKNQLRRMISQEVGRERNEWHNSRESKITCINLNVNKVKLDINKNRTEEVEKPLFDWFEEIEQVYDRLRKLLSRQNVLELNYEDDILEDPTDAYQSVCAFLNIEPTQPDIELRKSNPFPLRDILKNYDEVAAVFRGTRYEWMLEG